MNELTRPRATDAAGAPLADFRTGHWDHSSEMRESLDISKIAPALVRAQAALENPARNRSVQVRTQAGSYQFRYATLDRITDLVRKALAENGLCVLQPIVATERGPALVTRLLHESGQWMECETLLPPLGANPQAFGSAVTYVRRYSISAMLNISADEDDDANRAAGNHYQDMPPRKERGGPRGGTIRGEAEPAELGELVGDAVARALVNRARLAEGVEEGHELLQEWLRREPQLRELRTGNPQASETLERELGAGLKRSLGVEPAAAFVAALRATTPEQVAALRRHWDGKWAEALGALRQDALPTYACLRRAVARQVALARSRAGAGDRICEAGPAEGAAA